MRLAIVRAPDGFVSTLGGLPDGVRLRNQLRGKQDVVLFFATRRAELERRFRALSLAIAPPGELWIAWPKRSARVATDLSERVIREIGAGHGLLDTKVSAVNDAWSGLRFVHPDASRRARAATA